MKSKLCKSEKNKMFCGVCGGIAEYFNWDPTWIRLFVIVIALFKGFGLLLYVLAAIIMPSADSSDSETLDADKLKNAKVESEHDKDNFNQNDKPHSDEDFNSFFKK